MKKSIVIMGSSRTYGDTRKVADYIIEKSESDFINLKDYDISYFDYEHKNQHDDFIPLIEKVLNYEVIIFSTPVYWYTMSATLKTFLDRISDLLKIRKDLGRQLRGKKMMVTATSSDANEYPELWLTFQRSAEYLGMEYLGHVHSWVENNQVPLRVKESLDHLIGKLAE